MRILWKFTDLTAWIEGVEVFCKMGEEIVIVTDESLFTIGLNILCLDMKNL